MKPHARRLWAALGGIVIALSVSPTLVVHAETGPDFDALSVNGTTVFQPPIQPIGGSGTWTFASSGPCAELSGGVEVSTTEIVEAGTICSVTGSGTYANVVCGFMTIAGTFSVQMTVTVPFTATETWTTTFTSVIVNFSGPINGSSVEGTSSDGDNDGGTSWPTSGQVNYVPTVGTCATGVQAAFTSLSLNVAEPTA